MRRNVRYTRHRNTLADGGAGDWTATPAATITFDGYEPRPASQKEVLLIGASVGQYVWRIPIPNNADVVRDDTLTFDSRTLKVDLIVPKRRRNLTTLLCTENKRA